VYQTLAKCKYFLYSTFNQEKGVFHYDTFAYVVYEALAHGVIVITVEMDVYRELYGDALYYIPLEKNRYFSRQEDMTPHPEVGSMIVQQFIHAVTQFESSPELQREYRQRGQALLHKYSQSSCLHKLFTTIGLPFTPEKYSHLFIDPNDSSSSSQWNGQLTKGCVPYQQELIRVAEQLPSSVICSLQNQILPIYHQQVLYINGTQLHPHVTYQKVILLRSPSSTPLTLLTSLSYTQVYVHSSMRSMYDTLVPVSQLITYEQLSDLLPAATTMIQPGQLQCAPSPHQTISPPRWLSPHRVLVLLEQSDTCTLPSILDEYPTSRIEVFYTDDFHPPPMITTYETLPHLRHRQYTVCILCRFTRPAINTYHQQLFGVPLLLWTGDYPSSYRSHRYIRFTKSQPPNNENFIS